MLLQGFFLKLWIQDPIIIFYCHFRKMLFEIQNRTEISFSRKKRRECAGKRLSLERQPLTRSGSSVNRSFLAAPAFLARAKVICFLGIFLKPRSSQGFPEEEELLRGRTMLG